MLCFLSRILTRKTGPTFRGALQIKKIQSRLRKMPIDVLCGRLNPYKKYRDGFGIAISWILNDPSTATVSAVLSDSSVSLPVSRRPDGAKSLYASGRRQGERNQRSPDAGRFPPIPEHSLSSGLRIVPG